MAHKESRVNWRFDNSYARLPEVLFVRQQPVPVRAPRMIIFNERLSESLGLNTSILSGEEGTAIFTGNTVPQGAEPIAQAYAGHQFGTFTILGDGRTILLGEHLTPDGRRVDIQLKGSGQTPFSRRGDGRAALGPMLREYIISEAMHALGIPTTRSLAVVSTGEPVMRETLLPGAILTRVAASHIRVGTFEYVAARGDVELLRTLADYTIARHYPELAKSYDIYKAFLYAMMERQAALIAQWQQVGFIHGVMNTDNMAISGETIDYGPCAFMDIYDPIAENLHFGVLLPANPAMKNAPFEIHPAMREAKWFMCPFEWTQHWGKEVESPLLHKEAEFKADVDIAVCKVKEQPLIGPYQPLNISLHSLKLGDRG